MNRTFFSLSCCLLVFYLTGCTVEQQRIDVERTSHISESVRISNIPINDESRADMSLCKRLDEIKKLPNRDPNDSDPIYEAILKNGNDAIQCLIEEITNELPMSDPRGGPVWQHYKVGDTAIFVLVRIIGNDDLLQEMLPLEYRDEWKTNGIYAYFNYVSETQNRRQLQQWWKERIKQIK